MDGVVQHSARCLLRSQHSPVRSARYNPIFLFGLRVTEDVVFRIYYVLFEQHVEPDLLRAGQQEFQTSF